MASLRWLRAAQLESIARFTGPSVFRIVRNARVLAAVTSVSALALPGVAAAGVRECPPAADRGETSSAVFSVAGSHGYTLNVRSERGIITIISSTRLPPVATISSSGAVVAANGGNDTASTYYAFGSPLDPRRVDAMLGSLGRIDVAFRPSGRVRVTRISQPSRDGACTATSKIVRRLGSFVGAIRFRGEGGYTRVDLSRARGSVGTALPGNCATAAQRLLPVQVLPASAAPEGILLSAIDTHTGVQFEAATIGSRVAFTASSAGSLGANLIFSRIARATAPAGSFVSAANLVSARVEPPAPFSGKAAFDPVGRAVAGAWSGTLKAGFPGATMPLTGPRFRASLGPDF